MGLVSVIEKTRCQIGFHNKTLWCLVNGEWGPYLMRLHFKVQEFNSISITYTKHVLGEMQVHCAILKNYKTWSNISTGLNGTEIW